MSMRRNLFLFALAAIIPALAIGVNADSTHTNVITRVSPESSVKPAPNSVVGRVTDQTGKPIGNVRWRISAVEEWRDGQWELYPPKAGIIVTGPPASVTDAEGRFALTFPDKARYDLQFDKEGFAPVFLYQVELEARELQVIMEKGVPVRGSIVRADGTPLTGKTPLVVKLQFPSRDVWFATSTHVDAQGRFEFPHVSPPAKAPFWKEATQWQIVCLSKVVRIDVAEGKPAEVRIEISQADIERDYRERGGWIATGP